MASRWGGGLYSQGSTTVDGTTADSADAFRRLCRRATLRDGSTFSVRRDGKPVRISFTYNL